MKLKFSNEVSEALQQKKPILALESTIITHGLPYPQSLHLARSLEEISRKQGVTPATIAVIKGEMRIGLEAEEMAHLASQGKKLHKFSSYDLPIAAGLELSGSTTVAGTSTLAAQAGIKVFATGGIGGVHKESHARMDISHDLKVLSETPLVVVSSGAKCILDLESTLESLETLGIPTLGWRCQEFPAFYYNQSGLPLSHRVQHTQEVAQVARHLEKSALLLLNPVPSEAELPREYIKTLIDEAHEEAKKQGVSGKALTPYLLSFMSQKSEGRTVETNCALIKSNVHLAAQVALELSPLL